MTDDPKKVSFANKNDVVDYITKGITPFKDDFDAVMEKVRNPDPDGIITSALPGNEVIIRTTAMSDEERKILDQVMTRAYENRVKNRNNVLKSAAIIGAAVIFGFAWKSKGERKKDAEISDLMNKMSNDGYSILLNKDDISYMKRMLEY